MPSARRVKVLVLFVAVSVFMILYLTVSLLPAILSMAVVLS